MPNGGIKMFSGLRLYLTLGAAAILAAGGLYILSVIHERDLLKEQLGIEQLLHEGTKQALDMTTTAIQEQGKQISKLTIDYQAIRSERDEVLELFKGHDLDELAVSKPGMLAKRFNAGTKRLFTDLVEETNTFYTSNRETKASSSETGASTPP